MIVLVTGGAGFIGSHVVDRLRRGGHDPRILDLVRSPYTNGDVEQTVGDLLDRDALARATAGCDAVVHLAAIADVNHVAADPARADLVNVRGTQLALEAALAEGVSRFVFASTVWVYGGSNGHGEVVDEETPLVLPDHFYTATKLAGEMYCRSYGQLYGLEATILRLGIPYGPRSRAAAVVAAFVARARAGEPLVVAGAGDQRRQFVYVEDLADGVVASLADSAAPGIYNLVGDEVVSVRAIAERVRDVVADVPIVYGEGRKAELEMRPASAERAARRLGWRARTPFDVGLRAYVDWVIETSGSPRASTDSTMAGSPATVRVHEPGTL